MSVFEVCVLGSGSKGNCIYGKAGEIEFLVDGGLSGSEIERRLSKIEADPSNIRYIFVTHEHSDHVDGLRGFTRKYKPVVYMNPSLYLSIGSMLSKGIQVEFFDGDFSISTLFIQPFDVSHDAVNPVGFCFTYEGKKVSIATDLGCASSLVKERIKDSHVLILESNHDERMLMNGSYPWPLKQRIASRFGHLSNKQAGEILSEVVHPKLQHIILAHLSEENNQPTLAKAAAQSYLAISGFTPTVWAADQYTVSERIALQ